MIKPRRLLVALPIIVLAIPIRGQALAQNSSIDVRSTGTGFVVGTQGQLLTNNHVVDKCAGVQVKRAGQAIKASVVSRDSVNDLALLAPERSAPGSLPIRSDPPMRIGEQIVSFGFPLNGALSTDGVLGIGNINALAGLANDIRMLQISVPVQPGNSGGPLVDRSGNVVGIVSSKLNALKAAALTGDVPQNVNFAIKTAIIRAFLEANGVPYRTARSSSRSEIVDVAERVKTYVFLVECVEGPIDLASPQNATVLQKTSAQATGGNSWNERLIPIKKGDTLSMILRDLGATPEEIKAVGAVLGVRGRDGNLKEGQKLRILLSPVRGSGRLQPVRVMLVGDQGIESVVALSDMGRYVDVDPPEEYSVPFFPEEGSPRLQRRGISAKSDRLR